MKKILSVLLFLTSASLFSQDEERIAFATPNKDTLFVKDDESGKALKNVWAQSKDEKKPVIIVASDLNAVMRKYIKKEETKKKPAGLTRRKS